MNTTSTQLSKSAALSMKKEQWGNYGLKLDAKESEWSIEAAEIVRSLIIPERIEDVPAAETALAEAKRRTKELDEARMPFTRKMDEIKERCTKHVKSVEPELESNQKKILAIKTRYAERQRQSQLKEQETHRIKLAMRNHVIECEAGFRTRILELTTALLTACLGAGKTMDEANEDVMMAKSKCTPYDFVLAKKTFNSTILSAEEMHAIGTEVLITDSAKWVQEFGQELDLKFSDYGVQLANREIAIRKIEIEAQQKETEILTEKTNAGLAASIDTQATLFTPEVKYGKDLKRAMIVDMPETELTAKIVDAAFMANWEKCSKYLRVTKWFSLNTSQKIKALGNLRTDDEKFSFTGLIFREEVK